MLALASLRLERLFFCHGRELDKLGEGVRPGEGEKDALEAGLGIQGLQAEVVAEPISHPLLAPRRRERTSRGCGLPALHKGSQLALEVSPPSTDQLEEGSQALLPLTEGLA